MHRKTVFPIHIHYDLYKKAGISINNDEREGA